MNKQEFDAMVLDEQRKWGPSGTATLLIESKDGVVDLNEHVKLPKSEGKSEPAKKVDPIEKILATMHARLAFGGVPTTIPASAHATLSEGVTVKAMPEGLHAKLEKAFSR